MEKILECPLCLDVFKSPKVLPCQHSYCLTCLYEMYRNQNVRADHLTCPMCKKVTNLRYTTKWQTTLSLSDLNEMLPNNLTLVALLDETANKSTSVKSKPSEACSSCTTNFAYYCNTCGQNVCETCKLSKHQAHEYFNLSKPDHQIKPQVKKRTPKPPAPDPPSVKDRKRLSTISEERPPPKQPLRRLPNEEIKLAVKLEPEIKSRFTVRNFLVDSSLDIYIIFNEDGGGIRKYNGKSGEFLFTLGADEGKMVDFAINQEEHSLVCIVSQKDQRKQVTCFSTTNGAKLQQLHIDEYKMITWNKQTKNTFILASDESLAYYNSDANHVVPIEPLKNVPSLCKLISMDCNSHGMLYLLFTDQPIGSSVVYALSLLTMINFPLPIYFSDFLDPKSILVVENLFLICDYGKRCVHILSKTKLNLKRSNVVICKADHFNWRPTFAKCVHNVLFIFDVEKASIYWNTIENVDYTFRF